VRVEFWPLNLLICAAISVGLRKIEKKSNTRRDRSEAKDGVKLFGGLGRRKRRTRTVVIVAQPLPGELPHKEADDTNHGNAASD
jgi:hypothetical protein